MEGLARENLEAVADELAVFRVDGSLADFRSIVPFVNTIPRQTELYKLMTTTPGESR